MNDAQYRKTVSLRDVRSARAPKIESTKWTSVINLKNGDDDEKNSCSLVSRADGHARMVTDWFCK